jgi:hypothetical protein
MLSKYCREAIGLFRAEEGVTPSVEYACDLDNNDDDDDDDNNRQIRIRQSAQTTLKEKF